VRALAISAAVAAICAIGFAAAYVYYWRQGFVPHPITAEIIQGIEAATDIKDLRARVKGAQAGIYLISQNYLAALDLLTAIIAGVAIFAGIAFGLFSIRLKKYSQYAKDKAL